MLRSPEKLLSTWTTAYRFNRNPQAEFFSSDDRILGKLRDCLDKDKISYALTLFSGATLVAPHIVDQGHALYLGITAPHIEKFLWKLQSRLYLIPPKAGGNLRFVLPFYRSSVFRDVQILKGFKVVSNLQLYLDLAGHPPLGPDQAEWIKARLKERKTPLLNE